MRRHKVRIVNGKMYISDNKINGNNRNADAIVLQLDREFRGLRVYCVLFSGDNELICKYDGSPIVLPDKAYERGDTIPLTVCGTDDSGVRVNVTNNSAFRVVRAQ